MLTRAACSTVLLVASALVGSEVPGQTRTASDFIGVLISRTPESPDPPEAVTWMRTPTPAEVARVFPQRAMNSGFTVWKCHLSASGRLTMCTLETQWPRNDPRYKDAASKLLPLLRADASTVEHARAERKDVLVQVPVYRRGSRSDFGSDCPPPFCVPVPPPPRP